MTLFRRHIIALLALIGTASALPAHGAVVPVGHVVTPPAANSSYVQYAQKAISPSKAKSIAAQRVPGAKFVDISRSGGQYRVRMLRKDGRVVDVLIDAATGRVLN